MNRRRKLEVFQKRNESQNSLSKKELLLLVLLIITYFFYIESKDNIINYPTWLNYVTFSLVFLVVCVFQRSVLFNNFSNFKKHIVSFSFIINFTGYIILSFFLSGISLIPFNYINIYLSKRNNISYVNCRINGVTTYSRNRCIYYEFNNKINLLYAYAPIMEDIKNNGNYDDYLFVAKVRGGVLGSHILVSWDIKKRKELK